MSGGIDLAEVAMTNDLTRLQVIGHNLANGATAGYRRDAAVATLFEPQLAASQQKLIATHADALVPRIETRTVQDAGTLRFTGNPLDVAIEDDSFFAVETPYGEAYTRDGAFQLDSAGRLVTAGGFPVMSTAGPLRLTTATPRIDKNGTVWEGEDYAGQLKLLRFTKPELLEKTGGNLFLRGTAQAEQMVEEGHLRQTYLENSNVSASQEMVQLMEVMRHFEASQRVIRGYDEMLNTAISTITDF